jgi:hypothetical protein
VAAAVARDEAQGRLEAAEVVGEARAVALDEGRARGLRAGQEQLPGERELGLLPGVLAAAVGVEAGFLRDVGGRGRARDQAADRGGGGGGEGRAPGGKDDDRGSLRRV